MNVTDFRNKVLSLNLNAAEITRIKNLTAKEFKFKLRIYTEFTEVTDSNFKQVWVELNPRMAKEDKFHRIQTHSMRTSKGFIDYSDLAYNGVTDDF